jgi:hypothetical protein
MGVPFGVSRGREETVDDHKMEDGRRSDVDLTWR